jgi:S-formylglutathione hydrolase FrmB
VTPGRATIAAALVLVAAAPPAAPAQGPRATVTDARRLDARLLELTVRTPALVAPTKVRVLLPNGYARSHRRYPVLYLLHGASDDFTSWTRSGDVVRATAGLPLIVVMPDGGRGGWYADWRNGGRGGPPRWETYHVEQLVGLVDRRFRTVAARRGRAIAGLSMGGFGALSYAARHPDRYASAASFSGGVDLNLQLGGQPAAKIAVDATSAQDGGAPGAIFGDYATENIRWRVHNPLDLAANLRGVGVTLRTGNGQPGGPLGGAEPDVIELATHEMSANVHRRLVALGFRHVWDDYGAGVHTWPYWAHDLRRTLPWLMRRFAHPAAPPALVSYRSIEPSYRVYGWRVGLRRPRVEFSTLSRAGAGAFALSGSGRATVTTPPRYRPGGRYRVRVATVGRRLRADRGGWLRVDVPLGARRTTVRARIAPLGD